MNPLSSAQSTPRRILSGTSASLCLLILIFFFLPWLKFSCRDGQTYDAYATQSGFQIMTGSFSYLDPELQADYEKDKYEHPEEKGERGPGADLGLLLFLAGILIAGFGALRITLKKATKKSSLLTLFGTGLALGILLLYAAVGFSAERGLTESDKMDTRIEYTGFLISTFIFAALAFVVGLAAYYLPRRMSKPQSQQNRLPPAQS